MDRPVDRPAHPPVALPEPRSPGAPYRVLLVCLGNICRSAMAGVVLEDRLRAAGLERAVEVHSAGTGPWHVGEPMDERAAATLTRAGYDATRHRGRQVDAAWLDEVDLVLAMDTSNHGDVAALGAGERLRMFRDLDPEAGAGDRDVPDPYYGGADGFDDVLATVERTCDALAGRLAQLLGARVGG